MKAEKLIGNTLYSSGTKTGAGAERQFKVINAKRGLDKWKDYSSIYTSSISNT